MTIATLIIDMQRDFFTHERLTRNRAQLTANINQLLRVSREHGGRIIWVKTEFTPDLHDAQMEVRKKGIHIAIRGTEGANILPELEFQETDTVLVKKRYSAFFNTTLDSILSTDNCSQLIVCGVNTHACVRTTVIDAYQRDYEVILARDCIDSYDQEHHDVSWKYMNGKLGESLGVAEISEFLAHIRRAV